MVGGCGPRGVDPDPFTIISLFIAFAGSAASITAVLLQQRSRTEDQAKTDLDTAAELVALAEELEFQLDWLVDMADNIERFIEANVGGTYSLANTTLGLTSISFYLSERRLDQYENIKLQLTEHCGALFSIEIRILKLLSVARVELTEESVRRSERFRETLRSLTSSSIRYDRALKLMRKAAEEGLSFARDLRTACKSLLFD